MYFVALLGVFFPRRHVEWVISGFGLRVSAYLMAAFRVSAALYLVVYHMDSVGVDG